MTEQERLERNFLMLNELLDTVRPKFEALLHDMGEAGFRIRAQEAYRSQARQLELFSKGLSHRKIGSMHLRRLALDVVDDDNPLHPSSSFVANLAILASHQGLQTGCFWGLPISLRAPMAQILARGDTEGLAERLAAHTGWDPLHIELPWT